MAELPSPASHVPAAYRFGCFVVDPLRRLVWRNTDIVVMPGKTFDLLAVLIENRGRILEKEELLSLLWPDAIVQENNLVRQISNLRRALGQKPEQHDYIVTVSGRGYGFVAKVVVLDSIPTQLAGATNLMPEPVSDASPAAFPVSSERPSAGAPPSSWKQQGMTTWAVLGASCLVLAATYTLLREPRNALLRTLHQLTYEAGLQNGATWSPDGQRLAYSSDAAGNADIWIQSSSDPTPTRLTHAVAADWQPTWSPDGQVIAFRSERESSGIYLVAAAGGTETQLTTFGYQPTWSPDGRLLLFVDSASVGPKQSPYVVAPTGGAPRQVRPDLTTEMRTAAAAWHPDGRVSLLSRDTNGIAFLTVPLDAGPPVRSAVSPDVSSQLDRLSLGRFVWSKSRRFLFIEGRDRDAANIWRIAVDPVTLSWRSAERLTTTTGRNADLALSGDGNLAFSSQSETTRLWALPYDPATGRLVGEPRAVTSGGPGEFDAAVPPDGTRVAFRTERINRLELWERSTSGGEERLLATGDGGRMSSPRWSRDATRLAFMRTASGDRPIRSVGIVTVAGGREIQLTIPESEEFVPDDWSPDGSLILGACRLAGQRHLGLCVTPNTEQASIIRATQLASDPRRSLICPRFSPDQRWISFMATDMVHTNVSTLYVMPAQGGTWVPITSGQTYDDKPRWSGDGRTIFFISDRGGFLNLWARRFDPARGQPIGEPFQVTHFDEMRRRLPLRLGQVEIGVSNDRVFLPISETTGRIWVLDRADR